MTHGMTPHAPRRHSPHHAHLHLGAALLPVLHFFKKNIVMTVALIAAFVTALIVPPDAAYLGYLDVKTLTCLFCVLAVVCALKNVRFFYILAQRIVKCFKNARMSVLALVYITFLGSMLIANDMALLTFLPLGFFVLHSTGKDKYMAFTFIMQNIAANLGGMLTPFGNPQNLYLYSYFNIGTGEFVKIMLPSFVTATLLIIGICLFVKPTPLTLKNDEDYHLPVGRTVIYSVLFVASILIVFRVIPYHWGTLAITVILLFMDWKSIKEVNYPLLATFCAFFVFSGNLARIPAVNNFFSGLLPMNTLLFGILSCQCISNVPSAVLLSHFTTDYASLLPAVNIGGLGTLIASLASLITFTEYKKHNPEQTKKYIVLFTAINFGFMAVLFVVQSIILK